MAKLVHLFLLAIVLGAFVIDSEAGLLFGKFKKFGKLAALKAKLGLGLGIGKLGLLGAGKLKALKFKAPLALGALALAKKPLLLKKLPLVALAAKPMLLKKKLG